MKKIYFILIFFLIILIIFSIYFLRQPNEGKIIEGGSTHSRIEISQDEVEKKPENLTINTDCFEIQNTQNITAVKQEITERSCVIRAMLIEPIGQITVNTEKLETANTILDLSDNTGVKLREKETEIYTQIQNILTIPQPFESSENLQIKVFTTNTEITGFFLDQSTNVLTVISIHSVASVNEKIITQFWQLVNSVIVLI